MGKRPKKESPGQIGPGNLVYQMKVTLKDVRPPIWRRIRVTGDTTLYRFHTILQAVMGWENAHAHQFQINEEYFGGPTFSDFDTDVINERSVKLIDVISNEKTKFLYQYDFGDNWEHEIAVEEIMPIDPSAQYPICLDGKRSCPPEDCGGPWGYEELLEIIQDPSHPEHEERLEWLGEDFKAKRFDLGIINRRLKTARR